MGAMSGWMLSMKMFLISAGVLSLAVALKYMVPVAVDGGPALWSVVVSWMKPPYLYIVINGIIITIAASSRFHQSHTEPAPAVQHLISAKTPPPAAFEMITAPVYGHAAVAEPPVYVHAAVAEPPAAEVVVAEVEDRIVDLEPVVVNRSEVDFAKEADDLLRAEAENLLRAEAEDLFDETSLPYNRQVNETFSPDVQLESLFPAREKPLVSSRFVHRKPNRIAPEAAGARALRRVARPKKQETLESTWKMITEGRHVPLTRHMKKSDTWDSHTAPAMDHITAVPKSATFKDHSNYESPSPPPLPPAAAAAVARIRKEPSPGQDELNRKVEAFIHKFNEDMRMQRQESLNQYMEMIKRGV